MALREDGFLTRCRLYSQQINNFLSRQQCWPLCVCACVSVSPTALPTLFSPLLPTAHGGSAPLAGDFLHPHPQLGFFQLCGTARLGPAVTATSLGSIPAGALGPAVNG